VVPASCQTAKGFGPLFADLVTDEPFSFVFKHCYADYQTLMAAKQVMEALE
jgi:hypothetical protein